MPARELAQPGEVGLLHAETDVNEDVTASGLDEEAAEGQDDAAVLVQPSAMGLPALGGRCGEKCCRLELPVAIGQVGHANVADADLALACRLSHSAAPFLERVYIDALRRLYKFKQRINVLYMRLNQLSRPRPRQRL